MKEGNDMTTLVHKKSRLNLFNFLKNSSALILNSGFEKTFSCDSVYPFKVNKNFYYLTGIKQPNTYLVLIKTKDTIKELLFIEEFDERYAKWIGHRLTKEEASSLSGIHPQNIVYVKTFQSFLFNLLQPALSFYGRIDRVYLDLERRDQPLYNSFGLNFASQIQEKFPGVKIKDCYDYLIELRNVKEKAEQDLVIQSVETTKDGILSLLRNAHPGIKECELEAYFDFELKKKNKIHSFSTIMASGKNAVVLHYVENSSVIQDGDLVLVDCGCETNEYASDITRTFPINGKFTPRQKQIYEIVLKANKVSLEKIKPGILRKEVAQIAKDVLTEECLKIGLIKNAEEIERYYYHGSGHALGLDVHDPQINDLAYVENSVLTVEPGLYIAEENIGIRIEDDLIVTRDGCEVISSCIPKEVEEIEAYMAKYNVFLNQKK